MVFEVVTAKIAEIRDLVEPLNNDGVEVVLIELGSELGELFLDTKANSAFVDCANLSFNGGRAFSAPCRFNRRGEKGFPSGAEANLFFSSARAAQESLGLAQTQS